MHATDCVTMTHTEGLLPPESWGKKQNKRRPHSKRELRQETEKDELESDWAHHRLSTHVHKQAVITVILSPLNGDSINRKKEGQGLK